MSTTTLELPPDVAEYLRVVRDALADLPADERDDLLAEVEASLLEAASDTSGSVAAKLGPPEEFAAELRSAAGLHEVTPAASQVSLFTELRQWAATSPRARALRAVAAELAPIWWAMRGYLAVGFLAVATNASWSSTNHAIPRIGSGEGGVVAILVAVALSVWLGLRTRGRKTRFTALIAAANIGLVLAVIPVAQEITGAQNAANRQLVSMAYASQKLPPVPEGLSNYGKPIQNIYPYSRDGKLLHDVLLYDGAGNPLEIRGEADPNRRIVVSNGGDQMFNAFPIRYYEPGTTHVAHPNAGPPVLTPSILTPTLTTTTP
jgi:hypothetical protein